MLDNQDTAAIRAQKKILVSHWHPCGQIDVKWGIFYDIIVILWLGIEYPPPDCRNNPGTSVGYNGCWLRPFPCCVWGVIWSTNTVCSLKSFFNLASIFQIHPSSQSLSLTSGSKTCKTLGLALNGLRRDWSNFNLWASFNNSFNVFIFCFWDLNFKDLFMAWYTAFNI